MTLKEFNDEFQFKYDAASNGGPDLNSYEKSLCLTQAVRDIIDEAYNSYETSEMSKRILAPLLKEHDSSIQSITDDFTDLKCFLVSLPTDLYYVLREELKMNNCSYNGKIENSDIDQLSTMLNNPFRRPNKRKVLKAEYSKDKFKIYSIEELTKYRIKYLKKHNPIILIDLEDDPTLIGTEKISGLSVQTNTELPEFIHDEIIDKAVIIAIKATRENNLQTQTKIG